jgi:hypothetical protein
MIPTSIKRPFLTLVASGAVFAACWDVAHWLHDTWHDLIALDFTWQKRLAIIGYRGVRSLVCMVVAYFFAFAVCRAVFDILRSLTLYSLFYIPKNDNLFKNFGNFCIIYSTKK